MMADFCPIDQEQSRKKGGGGGWECKLKVNKYSRQPSITEKVDFFCLGIHFVAFFSFVLMESKTFFCLASLLLSRRSVRSQVYLVIYQVI
jgi:hypothetical protein